jgi:hypothetical protein
LRPIDPPNSTYSKMAAAASVYPPLDQRPVKNTVLLFDVDDTLTKPRQVLGSIKALAIPS